MNTKIEVSEEWAQRVAQEASRRNIPPQRLLEEILEQALPVSHLLSQEAQARGSERAERFLRWAESHRHDSPLLSDEAVSREAIYGGHE